MTGGIKRSMNKLLEFNYIFNYYQNTWTRIPMMKT
jgi:hypothetical protein